MYAATDIEVDTLLMEKKTEIRLAFAYWLMYKPDVVAWIPELLSEAQMERSENLLRLEFIIDTGATTKIDDERARATKHGLLRECPYLAPIHFGIWIRSLTNNGFVEHKPA